MGLIQITENLTWNEEKLLWESLEENLKMWKFDENLK